MKKMKVRLTFTEEMLGTANNNKDIHAQFIASKAPDAPKREEEIEAIGVAAEIEKSMTVLPRTEDGKPMLWDYQIKGFFKNACKAMNAMTGAVKLTAFKTKIDNLVFIEERKIPLIMPEGMEIGDCQRPLRAETAQGPRVALANSETVPVGTQLEFTVIVFEDGLMKNARQV
jgi:hypothetical protein